MTKILTIISDCLDENAKARQEIRYSSFVPNITTKFIGTIDDIGANGNLIDAIDAYQGTPGIIVANVAPRGSKEKYPNGIPFCFHQFGELLIVGTPNCFELACKLGLFSKTNETDVLTVCSKYLSKEEAQRIAESQFRSYEYLPLLVKWILESKKIEAKEISITPFSKESVVWHIDNFGNCKTTARELSELSKFSKIRFFERLTDVPEDGEPAIIRGSSGYKGRFLELVVKRGSASRKLSLGLGSVV
ncbi:MAG: SAM-dependent chlorinase/fluorinase [Candidatus Pacebacteria bacterium]|nr:SAM-dependent chlorinase/fluorinase [Candidatus Paceibacterota bacterium]MBP9839880.1 SAM-dependent chlorinase/fluorinase [Candidatus Paceibacterota bacterium]